MSHEQKVAEAKRQIEAYIAELKGTPVNDAVVQAIYDSVMKGN